MIEKNTNHQGKEPRKSEGKYLSYIKQAFDMIIIDAYLEADVACG